MITYYTTQDEYKAICKVKFWKVLLARMARLLIAAAIIIFADIIIRKHPFKGGLFAFGFISAFGFVAQLIIVSVNEIASPMGKFRKLKQEKVAHELDVNSGCFSFKDGVLNESIVIEEIKSAVVKGEFFVVSGEGKDQKGKTRKRIIVIPINETTKETIQEIAKKSA